MSILEKEIVEKFHQLDSQAQERVLARLVNEQQSAFDYKNWWTTVESLQESIRNKSGAKVNALSLLDELREEES